MKLRVFQIVALLCVTAVPLVGQTTDQLAPQGMRVSTLTDTIAGGVGGVAVDLSGNVYTADFGDNVWKVKPDGRRTLFATGFYSASGNAIDSRGRLLQSNFNGNYISRVERNGEASIFAGGFNGPVGIAAGPSDTLYVVNCRGNSVSKVSPDGTVTPFASGDHFSCPNGITYGPNGGIYVVNFGDGKVLSLTREGEVSQIALVPGTGNGHVAMARGDLYVTAFQSHRLYKVTLDGEVTLVAGTGQPGEQDGPGAQARFTFPNGIAVGQRGDRLFVNDFINRSRPGLEKPPIPLSVVRQIMLPTLSDIMLAALHEGGADALRAAHSEWKANPFTRAAFTELEINGLGYRLMGAGRLPAAIATFESNVEAYPNSPNTYDSLGEAYKNAGRTAEAIENYQKSLELNPGNTNATQMLQELQGS